jgi:hypothetical protein
MGGHDVVDWATSNIATIRRYSDRPIVIRSHPGDKSAVEYITKFALNRSLKNIRVSEIGTPFMTDLQNSWAVVNHNSSPAVGAAIEGYPVFVTDPIRSQCTEIANMDLANIESPSMPDRNMWVQRLSMFHWNFKDLEIGSCWNHMRQYV